MCIHPMAVLFWRGGGGGGRTKDGIRFKNAAKHQIESDTPSIYFAKFIIYAASSQFYVFLCLARLSDMHRENVAYALTLRPRR